MERQDSQLDADRYRVTQRGAGAPCHRRRTRKAGGVNDLRGDRFLDNYRMERGRCNYESEAAHTDVLELGKLLEAVARALSAETRLLDAAEGGELSGDDSFVDPDHA